MAFTERDLVQLPLVDRLAHLAPVAFEHVPGSVLARRPSDPLIEADVRAALIALNPLIGADPQRAEPILHELRRVALDALAKGPVAANREMTSWLQGQEARSLLGVARNVTTPIRLVDFEDPANNRWVVSEEVELETPKGKRRLDIVLWCNGFPLVVIETKSPVDPKTSWGMAASELERVYVPEAPAFFAANLLLGALDGREFTYGAVGQAPEEWLTWRSGTEDDSTLAPLARSLHRAELLLTPAQLLTILKHFVIFTQGRGVGAIITKLLPRYPQVEAVAKIVARAQDPTKKRGLVCHFQGSGKTLIAGFAARVLRHRSSGLDAPTILLVVDRDELSEQTEGELRGAAMFPITKATSRKHLRRLLATDDARGVILTTVQLFDKPDLLSNRSNIVVLPDECHRTQEGVFGTNLRASLPNATLIGLTGTPIATADRDTFEAFGDPSDPDGILDLYSVDRSIEDGMTVPIKVETRTVDFDLDRVGLDADYDRLATGEGLSDEQKERVAREVARRRTVLESDAHVRAVCADIVPDFLEKVRPSGMKGLVVVASRKLCIRYEAELRQDLAAAGSDLEVAVVMTVDRSKDAEAEGDWSAYRLDAAAEATIKRRFRNVDDKLALLVVTAKLLTGFDAKILGVEYLDKEMHGHTLGQGATRPNRTWKNPRTGQIKHFGRIVDYIGLGDEIAAALSLRAAHAPKGESTDVADLIADFGKQLAATMTRFAGITRSDDFAAFLEAQARLAGDEESMFNTEFGRLAATFELLMPDARLYPYRDDYRWLAKIYASMQPPDTTGLLLERVGAKTRELVGQHISNVRVTQSILSLELDAETARKIREMLGRDGARTPKTIEDVLKTIEYRIAHLAAQGENELVYQSLAEKVERLRRMTIANARESLDYMERLLELARDVLVAERMAQSVDDRVLVDPKLGALTQLFREFQPDATPDIIERFVSGIDKIAGEVMFSGWQEKRDAGDRQVRQQLRVLLKTFGLARNEALFERALAYVRENY